MASKLLTLMLISIIMTSFKPGLQLPLITTATATATATSISASPSYFAISPSPSRSAALTPDVTPLLPSPGPDSALSPSGSSIIPTIPSNPSPPNPESILAPQPLVASSPNGLLMPEAEPDSSSVHMGTFTGSVFVSILLALWFVQI